jgi:hypothetical protein
MIKSFNPSFDKLITKKAILALGLGLLFKME